MRTHKKCAKYHKYLPAEAFHKHSGTSDGLATRCRECQKEDQRLTYKALKAYKQANPPDPVGEKVCSRCKEVKPAGSFGTHPCTADGLKTTCKACEAAHKQEVYPERAAELNARTKSWRDRARVHKVPAEKICSSCKQLLPADTFTKKKATATGLASACRACSHRGATPTENDPVPDTGSFEPRGKTRGKTPSQMS